MPQERRAWRVNMNSRTGGPAPKRLVISYPLKTRAINRVREWETQFWLLVMSGVVITYMALTGLKARIKGKKTNEPDPADLDR